MDEVTYLILEQDNGEQWEDYYKCPTGLYIIPKVVKEEQIEKEWKQYVFNKMIDKNITVNFNYPSNIMSDSIVTDVKLHKKILKEHSFEKWIILFYNAKLVQFIKFHDYINKI